MPRQYIKAPVPDRFWAYVEKTPSCWLWTGYIDGWGYGRMQVRRRAIGAHRVSYELAHGAGSIPSGYFVCHTCDNPRCVNPDHLWLGSSRANTQDAAKKGRMARGSRHYRAALTEHDVLAIRAWHNAGEPATGIAQIMGVTPWTIRDVIAGRTWRHVA
jgi:hypothetical protein